MNKKLIQALLCASLFLVSCSLTPNVKLSGLANLEKKQESLTVGVSNKNDVIGYLGEAILKDHPDNNSWAYLEILEGKNIFGKTKLIKNNILLLSFNERGVLSGKRILNINDIKKLELDQDITISKASTDSFSSKFFGRVKKRFQNRNIN